MHGHTPLSGTPTSKLYEEYDGDRSGGRGIRRLVGPICPCSKIIQDRTFSLILLTFQKERDDKNVLRVLIVGMSTPKNSGPHPDRVRVRSVQILISMGGIV